MQLIYRRSGGTQQRHRAGVLRIGQTDDHHPYAVLGRRCGQVDEQRLCSTGTERVDDMRHGEAIGPGAVTRSR